VIHEEVDVWGFSTTESGLDWQPGTDHSVAIFGDATAWCADGAVPVTALCEQRTFRREPAQ
jgi:hypothetical protein